MKKNAFKLNNLKDLTVLSTEQSISLKGGDDKRPPRPPGPPHPFPGGGVLPNSCSPDYMCFEE